MESLKLSTSDHLIVNEEDTKEGLGSLAPLSLSRSLSEEELFKFSTDLDMASFKRKLDPP